MKVVIVFCLLMAGNLVQAQSGYEVSKDPENARVKVLQGIISKAIIEQDTSFAKWYTPNKNAYAPDTAQVAAFKKAATQKLQFVIFGGTWCEDTQFILPRFFKLQEMGGIPDNNITFFGVDRSKKTLGHVAGAFNIINVPTIIIMKDGKELGRVVEYGKTGKWNKELADIIRLHYPI